VRITTPYCTNFNAKKDLVRTIIELLKAGKPLPMVEDNLFVPTYIPNINAAIANICNNFVPQIYHVVPEFGYSAYEVGQIIARNFGLSPSLVQKTTFDVFNNGKAPRPQFSKLTNTRNLGLTMQNFEDGIKLLLN
jgi:dTDP-4-dehydrorhamnose reductase